MQRQTPTLTGSGIDLILYNGSVLTIDAARPQAGAVAVRGNRIAAVGSDREILPLRGSRTELFDLQGRTLLPGFNDSHIHLFGYALTRERVDLRRCAGIGEVIEALRRHIREKKIGGGGLVCGWGWNQAGFREKRMPTRADLDRASTDHNLVLMRSCTHVYAVNTRALRAAGIFDNPPAVPGGGIDLDEKGVPTGVLKERAMDLVKGLLPPVDGETFKAHVLAAAADCVAAGLTSVQTEDLTFFEGGAAALLDAYFDLDRAGRLPLRINTQLLLPSREKLAAFLELGCRTGDGSDFFRIGPFKLLTDGSLGGRTAALAAPYADAPGECGIPIFSREMLEELVGTAHRAGMQVAAHAIGDAALAMVLDAFRKAQQEQPRRDPRFRVIHASVVRPELLARFVEQGVIADIQPSFVPSDHRFIEERLGAARAPWAHCWKEFRSRGIPLGGGSDCPVESYKPLCGIHAAVTRQDAGGNPPGGWMPRQKLSLAEALELFTLGSAYCTFDEKIKGSVTPGKLADLAVLSADIGKIDPAGLRDVDVDLTVIDGKIAYSRP